MAVVTEDSRLTNRELARCYQKIALSKAHDCWVWKGAVGDDSDTPVIYVRNKTRNVRTVFFHHFAPKAKNMVLCRRPGCVNPHHKRRHQSRKVRRS